MGQLRNRIIQHLQASWWVYLFVGVFFIAGIVFGSIGVKVLDEQQTTSLRQFLDEGFAQFDRELNYVATTRQAIMKNLFNLGKIFFLGLTVIGFPLILTIIFTRGFALGFTVAFLIKEKALQGAIIALLSVVPPNLLSLPAYIMAASAAINFSVYLIRGRGSIKNVSTMQYAAGYLLVMLGLALLLLGAAFIEGYLSPFFILLFS